MKYNVPGSPTACAQRRGADLKIQRQRKIRQARRSDRRRIAFTTMRYRRRIVKEYEARRRTCQTETEAAAQTAERYNCSKSTVRRFARAMRTGGTRALLPHYQIVATSRSELSWEIKNVIFALRTHLGWCAQRIAVELAARQIARLSHMTIYRLFRRYHIPVRTYHPVGKRDGINYREQKVKAPNWTWHIDFAGPWIDTDGIKRSLVIVIDSYSRMILALEVIEHQDSQTVEGILEALFARYRTPKVLISDNGRAFAPSRGEWEHRFATFLGTHGVEHRRTRNYYPQTNGKAEAAVKTVKRELLAVLGCRPELSWTWADVQAQATSFQGWYNFYRPHGALKYQVPATRYAGISLPKHGLENIFGIHKFIPEATIIVSALPYITKANRLDRLALISLN